MKCKFKSKLVLAGSIFVSSQALSHAAVIVDSYTYGRAPSPPFIDEGGDLTDGVTNVDVWPTPAADITPLVGWLSVTPEITFNFTSQEIKSFSLWLADSDGSAGVSLASSVRLFDTATAGASFDQSFAITNPTDSGSMVKFDFEGFSVTTDSLSMELTQTSQWVMLSEVRFNAVPEPSGALLATSGLALLALRRKRRQ